MEMSISSEFDFVFGFLNLLVEILMEHGDRKLEEKALRPLDSRLLKTLKTRIEINK